MGAVGQVGTVDGRLDLAVRASLGWYEDVFAAHGIPTRTERGLWSALGQPPRWHSAAKTLRPDVSAARVLRAVASFGSGSVADSYGTLDLAGHGYQPLFRATWLFRPPAARSARSWPKGWSVVQEGDELAAWNAEQDTTDVLIPALLHHHRFTFLVRRARGRIVAGAVLHDVDDAVELSNTWATGTEADEIPSMLDCAETLFPQRAVVGYCRDEDLGQFTEAGLRPIGPHVVWVKDPAGGSRPGCR
jgi:hypothetical protein